MLIEGHRVDLAFGDEYRSRILGLNLPAEQNGLGLSRCEHGVLVGNGPVFDELQSIVMEIWEYYRGAMLPSLFSDTVGGECFLGDAAIFEIFDQFRCGLFTLGLFGQLVGAGLGDKRGFIVTDSEEILCGLDSFGLPAIVRGHDKIYQVAALALVCKVLPETSLTAEIDPERIALIPSHRPATPFLRLALAVGQQPFTNVLRTFRQHFGNLLNIVVHITPANWLS